MIRMGRPREFDEEQVLTAAMHAFRHGGYARLTVGDLEKATGLRASSLYNAYGDKAGLFTRTLQHYVDTFVAPRLGAHAGPGARLEDLEQLYLSILEPPYDDGGGCLVTNSAAEFGAGSIAAPAVKAAIDLVEQHVGEVLQRELGSTAEAPGLVLLYQGMLVLSRAGLDDDRHRQAVQGQFARLRAAREGATT
jgi:TetR/AcrR family transcriptional repressor of nem operon